MELHSKYNALDQSPAKSDNAVAQRQQPCTMESFGSVSMAYPLATIERVPSMAGSSGALSTATEAESEMTDEGAEDAITPRQTYFMCFATDLLGAYEQIKKRGLVGAKAIDDVSTCIFF